jgi:hypothetical protein
LSQYHYMEDEFEYDAVSSALHEVAGGIPDLGVVMWIAVQNRLLRAGKSKVITTNAIRQVAKSEFAWVGDAVAALKEGTEAAYRRYSDLYFRHLKPSKKSSIAIPLDIPLDESGEDNESELIQVTNGETKEKPKTIRRRMTAPTGDVQPTILSIVEVGKKTQKSAYQSLFDVGFIGSVDRFLK